MNATEADRPGGNSRSLLRSFQIGKFLGYFRSRDQILPKENSHHSFERFRHRGRRQLRGIKGR